MKAKCILFVFLFCNAILFSATHLTPVYRVPSGDSTIFIDVSSYGDSDAEIEIVLAPTNFSLSISDTSILATSSSPVEKMISLQGVPESSFVEYAVFEIRNLNGKPHPRRFTVKFIYELEVSLGDTYSYYYNSHFMKGRENCLCYGYLNMEYFLDIEEVTVYYSTTFDYYFTCDDYSRDDYNDLYKLYHSLECIASFPFTASSTDGIESILLEIIDDDENMIYSDSITYVVHTETADSPIF